MVQDAAQIRENSGGVSQGQGTGGDANGEENGEELLSDHGGFAEGLLVSNAQGQSLLIWFLQSEALNIL